MDKKTERNVVSFRYTQINQKLDFLICNNTSQSNVFKETTRWPSAGDKESICANNNCNLNMN